MRLNKFLANKGLAARRVIDDEIDQGRVAVNGQTAKLGYKLQEGDRVFYKDTEYLYSEETAATGLDKVYLAFNKPPGVVCTLETKERDNLINYFRQNRMNFIDSDNGPNYNKLLETKIYPVGRLDKNTRGLLILTNDGDLTQKITHPKFESEKEYLVACANPLTPEFLNAFSSGVTIDVEDDDGKVTRIKTQACQVKQITSKEFLVTLTQGYKRQIREMCKELDNRVADLGRIRVGNVALNSYKTLRENDRAPGVVFLSGLKEGFYTCLNKEQVEKLLE